MKIERVDPQRAKVRRDMEDAHWTNLRQETWWAKETLCFHALTLRLLPKANASVSDMLLPILTPWITLNTEPRRVNARMERVDPRVQ